MTPTSNGAPKNPTRISHVTTVNPVPWAHAGQLIGSVQWRPVSASRHQALQPRTPAIVPGTLGNASAAPIPAAATNPPNPRQQRARPESVHHPVADQPADEHEPDERDVAERRDPAPGAPRLSRKYSVAQELPASSTVAPAIAIMTRGDQRRVYRDARASPRRPTATTDDHRDRGRATDTGMRSRRRH